MVENKNNKFRANNSPAQTRLIALNSNDTSFVSDESPSQSRNRSDLVLDAAPPKLIHRDLPM